MKSSKLYLLLYFIFISILLLSCVETSYVTADISFNPKAKTRKVFDTDIIKGVKLIKLESDSCIVGRIDRIICNDTLLYVMDRHITEGVFIFTTKGRFVNKISRQGHGKYEYTQLWDIFFDKRKNALCLLCNYDKKIISFTPDGKKILGESRLPLSFTQIVPTVHGYIGYRGNSIHNPSMPYNLWTMDKSFNLIDGFLPVKPQLEGYSHTQVCPMSVYGDVVYFKPEYENTIYQIKEGEISPIYVLSFGSKTFPDLFSVPSHKNRTEWVHLVNEKVANIYYYVETSEYILMSFILDHQYCLGIYNKHTQTTEIARQTCYVGEYLFSFGQIRGMDQSAIYSILNYEEIYEVWHGHNEFVNFEKDYPKQVDNLRKLFPHLEENGNPFIAIYSLK